MADQLGKSVGDMYKGAFVPGFMLMGLYVLWVVILAIFKPKMNACPAARGTYLPRVQWQRCGYTSLAVVSGHLSTIVAIFLANPTADLHWWQGGNAGCRH